MTYCDQLTEGGGWELLAKMDGSSPAWAYGCTLNDMLIVCTLLILLCTAAFWQGVNLYRDTDLDPTLWNDAKYHSFNYGIYSNIRAR